MILLHAVVPRNGATVGLQRVVAGDVAVLYEECDQAPSRERDAVLAHGARILELAADGPVLPMRYGTAVADVSDLAAVVEDNAPTWQRRLDALHGQVELLVHVQVDGEAQRSDGETGRSYLRRRSAVLGARDRAVQAVGTILGAWPHQLRPLPDGKRVAVLVGREVTAPARAALEAWAADQPDIGIVVTGPWPPFSFSEDLGA